MSKTNTIWPILPLRSKFIDHFSSKNGDFVYQFLGLFRFVDYAACIFGFTEISDCHHILSKCFSFFCSSFCVVIFIGICNARLICHTQFCVHLNQNYRLFSSFVIFRWHWGQAVVWFDILLLPYFIINLKHWKESHLIDKLNEFPRSLLRSTSSTTMVH